MTAAHLDSPSVSIVVPAYNEEARLAGLFAKLAEHAETELERAGMRYLETVIVDDGSTDATSGLLSVAAGRDPHVRPVLGRANNLGKGATIREGVAAARGDLVLLVDVDLSTPLSDAWKLREAMESSAAPMAIGSRDLRGSDVEAPLHRRAMGACFNLAVRSLTGLRYADTQCGFKLIATPLARRLLEEQISAGFAFDVELLLRADLAGVGVNEVPVSYDHDDRSKVRIVRASLAMARDLVRVSRRLKRGGRRAPGKLPGEGARPS